MKELFLALWIAQGADMATTVVGLNRGCAELNPLYRSTSVPAMVAVKGASTFTITALAWGAKKKGHTRQAKVMLWTGIIVGAGAAGWNLMQLPHC